MLRIWGRPTSICTQRVLWACAELNLEYDLTLASATMGEQGHISSGHTPYGIVDTTNYKETVSYTHLTLPTTPYV